MLRVLYTSSFRLRSKVLMTNSSLVSINHLLLSPFLPFLTLRKPMLFLRERILLFLGLPIKTLLKLCPPQSQRLSLQQVVNRVKLNKWFCLSSKLPRLQVLPRLRPLTVWGRGRKWMGLRTKMKGWDWLDLLSRTLRNSRTWRKCLKVVTRRSGFFVLIFFRTSLMFE